MKKEKGENCYVISFFTTCHSNKGHAFFVEGADQTESSMCTCTSKKLFTPIFFGYRTANITLCYTVIISTIYHTDYKVFTDATIVWHAFFIISLLFFYKVIWCSQVKSSGCVFLPVFLFVIWREPCSWKAFMLHDSLRNRWKEKENNAIW